MPHERIADFCRKWEITELSVFGSVLRDDFRPDSDIDVLVTFAPSARWSLLDLVGMEEELAAILGRKVDLVERASVEKSPNFIRRRYVLESVEPVYVAG
jgi:uncharacterized protein